MTNIRQFDGAPADYQPGYSFQNGGGTAVATDPAGNLLVRSQVLTDEGTFRANFANSSLAVSLGTVTLTNGSTAVTWSISATTDLHAGDYIKLDADAETAWAQIETVDSLTSGTLVAAYGGTGGTSNGSRALVAPFTGTGGTAPSVASGACSFASGTTINATTGIKRKVDYAPLVYRARISMTQRIANQAILAGLREDVATPRWFARVRYDGTTNTTAIFETGRNPTGAPSASETQSTTFTLPNGLTSAALHEVRVEMLTEKVVCFVDGVRVAEHARVMPAQHDDMAAVVEVANAGSAPGSTTTVAVDYLTAKNHNKVEVGVLSDAEQVVAAAAPAELFAYNVAGVIAINTDLLVIDCSRFRSLSINCVSMGTTGVVTVQWSNDPAFSGTPITATLYDQAGATSTTFNAGNILRITQVLARYCRLRLTTATTAGTTTINVQGFQQALAPPIATQPVSGSVTITSTRIVPNASDGHSTTHHLISAATTNATSVKASAGAIGLILVSNNNAAARYFKLYNKASAPTVGTDTPILTVFIPPNSTVPIEGNSPIRCSTGIAYALTTGIAVADTGAVGASEMSVGMFYT